MGYLQFYIAQVGVGLLSWFSQQIVFFVVVVCFQGELTYINHSWCIALDFFAFFHRRNS